VDRLRALYPESSGRARKHWLGAGRVRVNGEVVRRGDVELRAGDRVELGNPSVAFPHSLRLVHDDQDIVVIEKPPGLLSIATPHERRRTAYRMLADYFASRRGVTPQGAWPAGTGRIFIVHRLDRETSGLLCFAKSPEAKRALQVQFAARSVRRIYVALVEGRVAQDDGVLTDRLIQDRSLRVRPTLEGQRGKEAITRYRVLERHRRTTLLELTLVTGRRSQIRAQLAHAGHPVVGDTDHGSRPDPGHRLALHATQLGFRHPRGHAVEFHSPVPSAFRRG
jgi:23S rRNA pseudouridine1911/1915/1917 synthase